MTLRYDAHTKTTHYRNNSGFRMGTTEHSPTARTASIASRSDWFSYREWAKARCIISVRTGSIRVYDVTDGEKLRLHRELGLPGDAALTLSAIGGAGAPFPSVRPEWDCRSGNWYLITESLPVVAAGDDGFTTATLEFTVSRDHGR
ncbi:MAG: hypothetical protein ACYC35_18340 [Pirellulales bacterium]